jgi:hypothetical protein
MFLREMATSLDEHVYEGYGDNDKNDITDDYDMGDDDNNAVLDDYAGEDHNDWA